MNKAELIDAVTAAIEASRADGERAVNAVIDAIKAGVVKDQKVQIVGFGTFEVRERKERQGRNPQTGEPMTIAASKSVAFKPGKEFKESL